jgi:hypothetical protein
MANRYFINGGVDNNWGSTSNWSTTSGGAGGSAVPLATDDVFFDANSPNCTVNTTARVALRLNFTGYTNTITMTQNITVSGNVTLGASMGIAGAGTLLVNAAATLTSNGVTWPNALTISGAFTRTLADNWVVAGTVTFTLSTSSQVLNGFQMECQGSLTITGSSSANLSGTTNFLITGTGTLTSTPPGGLRNNLTINSSGTVTFANGNFLYSVGTLTYTAGTISMGAATSLTCTNTTTANGTFACAGITWPLINISGSGTTTLNEDLNASGLVSLGATTTAPVINGNAINCPAGLRYAGTTGAITGTTVLNLTGTGTVDAPSASTTGRITLPITIDAGGGTITVSDNLPINFNGLNYVSGTVITDAGTWATGGGSSGGMIQSRVFTGQ